MKLLRPLHRQRTRRRARFEVLASAELAEALDIEPHEDLPSDVFHKVCGPEERGWLEQQAEAERGRLARGLFSAKEAFFKAVFPRARIWLEFEDATVRVQPDEATFEVEVLAEHGPELPRRLTGHMTVEHDHVWTAVVWRAR